MPTTVGISFFKNSPEEGLSYKARKKETSTTVEAPLLHTINYQFAIPCIVLISLFLLCLLQHLHLQVLH